MYHGVIHLQGAMFNPAHWPFETTPGSIVPGVVHNHQECLFQVQLSGLSWQGLPLSLDVGRGPVAQGRRLAEAALRQEAETDLPVVHGRESRFRGTVY